MVLDKANCRPCLNGALSVLGARVVDLGLERLTMDDGSSPLPGPWQRLHLFAAGLDDDRSILPPPGVDPLIGPAPTESEALAKVDRTAPDFARYGLSIGDVARQAAAAPTVSTPARDASASR